MIIYYLYDYKVSTLKQGGFMYSNYKIREDFYKNNTMKIGNYYCYEGVPYIELIVPKEKFKDGNNPSERTVFLSAFRKYSFQISGTYDGEIEYASTPIFGLESIVTAKQVGPSNLNNVTMQKYFIHCIAMDAIRCYCTQYNIGVPNIIYKAFKTKIENNEWYKFINNVWRFCKNEKLDNIQYSHYVKKINIG